MPARARRPRVPRALPRAPEGSGGGVARGRRRRAARLRRRGSPPAARLSSGAPRVPDAGPRSGGNSASMIFGLSMNFFFVAAKPSALSWRSVLPFHSLASGMAISRRTYDGRERRRSGKGAHLGAPLLVDLALAREVPLLGPLEDVVAARDAHGRLALRRPRRRRVLALRPVDGHHAAAAPPPRRRLARELLLAELVDRLLAALLAPLHARDDVVVVVAAVAPRVGELLLPHERRVPRRRLAVRVRAPARLRRRLGFRAAARRRRARLGHAEERPRRRGRLVGRRAPRVVVVDGRPAGLVVDGRLARAPRQGPVLQRRRAERRVEARAAGALE